MQVLLDNQHLWAGNWYGPGEVEIPDDLAKALGLAPEQDVSTGLKGSKKASPEKTNEPITK